MSYQPQLDGRLTLVELQTVGSTNDHAKDLARQGAAEGTLVWAHEQTMGRGRQGNSWVPLPGNLYMSLILRPEIAPAQTGQLSFVAAVALAETLKEILPREVSVTLKWPNDLLLNGKKSAGILLESDVSGGKPVDWVVIGIGVNVTGAPEGANCLAQAGASDVQAGQVLEKLAARLTSLYDLWQKRGFAPIREEWLLNSQGLGGALTVRLPRETFTGTFTGIDADGALQIEMADGGVRSIASGEVFSA